MTLDEFETEIKLKVEEFCAEYRKMNAADPDGWPSTLDSQADWLEQFDFMRGWD